MRNDLILRNTIGDFVMPCRRVWRAVIDLLNWYHGGGTLCDRLYVMEQEEKGGAEGGGGSVFLPVVAKGQKLRRDF